MKKATKITGIIFAVLLGIEMVLFVILGFTFCAQVSALNIEALSPEDQQAAAYLATMGIFFIVYGFCCIPGFVLDIVITCKNRENSKPMGKGAGICLGIFGFLFGAYVPGVLQIIESATTKDEVVNA